MELISVIVPVYNVEKYLDKCIESIVNQTYTNLEIILVDDGSPDRCSEMCDEWAKKDERIKVIHKINGGLSDARNAGMDAATGEYIGFVDGDDYIREDMYDLLLSDLLENESDISACGVKMLWDDGKELVMTPSGKVVLDNEQAVKAIVEENYLKQPVWYKLYKKELVSDIPFPVGKYHEDVFWSYNAIARAKKVSVFDTPCYFYIQRSTSIMGEAYSEKRFDAIEALNQRCEFICSKYPTLTAITQSRFIGSCLYHSQLVLRSDLCAKKEYLKKLYSISKDTGKEWKISAELSSKQKLWLSLYLIFPQLTAKVRNVLKIGL